MNKVIQTGRLVRDPELKATKSGKYVASFSIAVYKGKDQANFFDCVAWEKMAEKIAQHKKGEVIGIEGRLDQRSWEKDGKKMSKVEIIADWIETFSRPGTVEQVEKVFADENPFSDDDTPF